METYYIFDVIKGQSFHLPVNLTLSTVAKLNEMIHSETNLRKTDQILLTAKGIALAEDKKLDYYKGTGTQYNPVFLFQRIPRDRERDITSNDVNYILRMMDDSIEQATATVVNPDPSHAYIHLPQCAKDCKKVSTQAVQACERFVQDHVFLTQAWTALMSNMDISVTRLQKLGIKFQKQIQLTEEMNSKAATLFDNFDHVLEQLKMIELPSEILANQRAKPTTGNEPTVTLYDWISGADTEHSVTDLVSQVKDLFDKFAEIDPKAALQAMKTVVDNSKSSEYRDIKGINKRFQQLEFGKNEIYKQLAKIGANVTKISEIPKNVSSTMMKEMTDEHKVLLNSVFDCMREIKNIATVFHRSKTELLDNLKSRLSGFIPTSYERLNFAHLEMVVFEEKCNGLRLRLDLIEQIKESPTLYVRSIAEVVRRLAFKKELSDWHKEHFTKCEVVYDEETELRKRYSQKLERHFLRPLFSGMFDSAPLFYVKALAQHDNNMPDVGSDHLRKLRQAIPELDEYMRVTTPQIYSRIAIKDPAESQPHQMRREESFFTKEPVQMQNLTSIHKTHFSANWISEDGMDGSPGPTIMMTRSPKDMQGLDSSLKSMPIAPSLHDLNEHGEMHQDFESGTSVAKSAPIDIPSRPMTRGAPCSSGSRFSTPEDNFVDHRNVDEQPFFVDDLKRSQTLEFLEPFKIDIATIGKGLRDVRAEVVNNGDKFREEFEKIADYISVALPREIEKVTAEHNKRIQHHLDEISALNDKLTASEENLKMVTDELEAAKKMIGDGEEKHQAEIKMLNSKVEELKAEVKAVEANTFKRLTIEYELLAERNNAAYEETIDYQEKEMQALRHEVEKKKAELSRLRADPDGEDFQKEVIAEIRAELEKEFKAKIELITKGVEQKKEEAVTRCKKELDIEIKCLMHQNNSLKNDLMQKEKEIVLLHEQLRTSSAPREDVPIAVETVVEEKKVPEATESAPVGVTTRPRTIPESFSSHVLNSPGCSNPWLMSEMKESVYTMDTSCMMASTTPVKREKDTTVVRSPEHADSEGNVVSASCVTQTFVGMQAMTMMVTVQDIMEGCTVLVIWDDRHNAYILFCSSPYLHFVKESSIRRMGLIPADPDLPRRNWILGRTRKLDMCIIKKPINRYGLPVDTKVYRADIEAAPIDVRPGSRSSASPFFIHARPRDELRSPIDNMY